MIPNAKANNNANTNRRYSLFNSSSGNSTVSSSSRLPSDKVSDGTILDKLNSRKNLIRRSTFDMPKTVCQSCKRFEVDLTNTSDNLSAIDAELKASRQVISLLQRQLELFQVEKEGLEKLIISQSESPLNKIDTSSSPTSSAEPQENLLELDDDTDNDKKGNEGRKKLLNLIQIQLYAKDEEIVKLKSSLKEANNDKEQLYLQLHMLEDDIAKLKMENSLLSENLALRDQTIVSLSNEVFEQTNNVVSDHDFGLFRQASVDTSMQQKKSYKLQQQQISKMTDTLEAYKKTNELLSSNVIKLTERCNQAEKKEIETRSQCQELEAKCCQIQSKLLSLLKEIEQSSKQSGENSEIATNQSQEVICSESVKLLIKRLLEDKSLDIPLSWKEGNRSKRSDNEKNKNFNQEYDELGFYIISDETDEYAISNHSSPSSSNTTRSSSTKKTTLNESGTHHLNTVDEGAETVECEEAASSQNAAVFRHHSIDATKNDESSWRLRWDDFIKDFDKVDLSKCKEFKSLLRSGIPQEYRCKIWKSLIDLKIGKERHNYGQDYYQSLLEPNRPQVSAKKTLNPSSKQIELDLLRTLPNNKYFETIDSPGTVRLRRVLTAYSEHNPRVGYCQGMNRLAAVALLVLPEEEAFWCLVAIVDKIMPIGYYNDLWLAQVDSSVVMEYVAIKMPNLNDHFKHYGIELSLFAWFLTIFVDGTPPALFLRLWDCFLYEGDKIMFRVALALLKMYENQLILMNNSVAVNNFLRSAVNAPMNIDQFFDIAFDWINPFSGRSLRTKRQHSFQTMRSGFNSTGHESSGQFIFRHRSSDNSFEDQSSQEQAAFKAKRHENEDDEASRDQNEEQQHPDSSIISI